MKVYIMRHGPAADRAASGRDFDRPLTEDGHLLVRRVAERLRGDQAEPLSIFSSPLVRARATAETLREVLHGPAVEFLEELGPDGSLSAHFLTQLPHWQRNALFVTHYPYIEQLIRSLTGEGAPLPMRGGIPTASILGFSKAVDVDHWHCVYMHENTREL